MALAAWGLGTLLLLVPRLRDRAVSAVARAGDRIGPRHWYGVLLHGTNELSDRLHDAEVRDLRNSLAAVLVPTGVLVAAALVFTPIGDTYEVGSVSADDLPVIALLALAVVAAFTVTRDRGRLRPVLDVSVVGFALAAVFAVLGAPDVALVAVLVETVFTLVFVGVFARLPADRSVAPLARPRVRRRNVLAAVVAGAGAFVATWAALSRPTVGEGDAVAHLRETPQAHGGDVVTVILADFRGLDTMVEVSVLVVAVAGVAALLRRGRAW
jgi:multicomponent Na+:H+ antiporter subunit A